uniref:Uncharacterized protein n=1 Tax=Anopheles arabiensis TaxID=7173 RepID=A0A2C9GQ49_ANOAR
MHLHSSLLFGLSLSLSLALNLSLCPTLVSKPSTHTVRRRLLQFELFNPSSVNGKICAKQTTSFKKICLKQNQLTQPKPIRPKNDTMAASLAKFMPADQPQQPMMMMGGQPMQQIPMQQMPAAPPAQPAAPAALVQDVSALLTDGGAQLIKN